MKSGFETLPLESRIKTISAVADPQSTEKHSVDNLEKYSKQEEGIFIEYFYIVLYSKCYNALF